MPAQLLPYATDPDILLPDEVAEYLRIGPSSDQHPELARLIAVAREAVEADLGQVLLDTKWRETSYDSPALRLTRLPLRSIEAARAVLIDTTTVSFSLSDLKIQRSPSGSVDVTLPVATIPANSPAVDRYEVEYRAGIGATWNDVPQTIRQAVMLLVGHWYENREPVAIGNIVNTLPFTVDALLTPHRAWRFG